jgi:adenylate kinase family enzyme
METPQTFIFIGRSGCGKGTQAKLLMEHIKSVETGARERPILYIETGNKFRDLVSGTSHTSRLAKIVADKSERQPDFLAIWTWSNAIIDNLMGDEHLILDGTPRSRLEAQVLDGALKFFGREKVNVIYIEISAEETKRRMEARGRADDKRPGDIDKRLAWFNRDVIPAIQFYEEHPDYNLIKLNGEQSIENVQKDLITALYGQA